MLIVALDTGTRGENSFCRPWKVPCPVAGELRKSATVAMTPARILNGMREGERLHRPALWQRAHHVSIVIGADARYPREGPAAGSHRTSGVQHRRHVPPDAPWQTPSHRLTRPSVP